MEEDVARKDVLAAGCDEDCASLLGVQPDVMDDVGRDGVEPGLLGRPAVYPNCAADQHDPVLPWVAYVVAGDASTAVECRQCDAIPANPVEQVV